ncbi:neurofilament medium polypeptide isoform X2 [Papilio machaon]|uniref:neurofilament medium polypeptide isoform X2 n=1 Tax=Papilio machaon TaxID=76193 RepID=UPI001E6645E6|nr:neurofilament medium polypeptide isoform X2 [Papilio machaon]
MKIPETSANIGAYYGNEENVQWQPNGVIIDNGVGGGIVGSGDAGVHRPPVYPVHIQRGHIPGYVMAEAYYPPAYPAPPSHAAPPDDFADYMWMENEEEFDKQVMQQLEEEALMEQCIEAMLEDEQRERHRPVTNGHNQYPTTSNGQPSCSLEEAVSKSTLNPLAAEFVPTRVLSPPTTEEKTENRTEEKPTEETPSPKEEVAPQTEPVESKEEIVEEKKTEETSETPEVSAADVQPIDKKKEVKKIEQKKVVKQDVKVKVKPVAVKSETKVQKKKEVKNVKSETRVEEKIEDVVTEIAKQSPPPVTEEVPSGIKPINYAAAAKANKPKKSTTPPITEKIVKEKPKPIEKMEKKEKTPVKDVKAKTEKTTVQRKNSTK